MAVVVLGFLAGVSLLVVYLSILRAPVDSVQSFVRAGCPTDGKKLVVAAGDSMTHASLSADYLARLRGLLGDEYVFVNGGRNGDTTGDLLQRLDEIVDCNPQRITVMIGTNDARRVENGRDDEATFAANYRAIVSTLQAQTEAQIALLSIPPLGEDSDSRINQTVGRYNAHIRQIATELGVDYLPVFETMIEILREHPPREALPFALRPGLMTGAGVRRYLLFQSWDQIAEANGMLLLTDQIHLSDRGGAIVAELITGWLSAR